jgi:hypothetical protein
MIPELRRAYNAAYRDSAHAAYQAGLEREAGCPIGFRLAETPLFLPPALRDQIVVTGLDIVRLLTTPEHQAWSLAALPPDFDTPRCDDHPLFLQVDFALARDRDLAGQPVVPRLIELQGFPSLYAFQLFQGRALAAISPGRDDLGFLLSGLDTGGYAAVLARALLAGHDPEHVVLLELEPERQKTLADFRMTERLWGIPTVDAATVEVRGRELWYRRAGRRVRILRIYNRIVPDELRATSTVLPFRFTDDLDVEWAGHPNWYFRWSKHSLPWLRHPAAPEAHLLSDLDAPPADLDRWVLKPLFAFAGAGVRVDVSPGDLSAIPEAHREQTLLMRKVDYEPLLETVDGHRSKVEVRLMLVWPPGDDAPTPVTTLVRLSQGAMMGVDFNRDRTWVGSSTSLWPLDRRAGAHGTSPEGYGT